MTNPAFDITPFAPTIGAKTSLGYAAEATAGTAVTATDFIPMDPDKLSLAYDPDRKLLPVAIGNTAANIFSVEENAKIEGGVGFPLFPTLGQKLLFLSGFLDTKTGSPSVYTHTGALSVPKPVTFQVQKAGSYWQYPGQHCANMKITCSSKSPVAMVEMTFKGITAETQMYKPGTSTSGITPITLVAATPATPITDQPYVFRHMQQIALLSGTGFPDVDDWEIELDWDLQEFRGANNTNLPTTMIPGVPTVKGKFTKLFRDLMEYNLFITKGLAPAPLGFSLTQTPAPATTIDSVTFTLPDCVYTKHDWKFPIKGMIIEEFDYEAMNYQGVTTMLTLASVNAIATAFTTT